MAIGALAFITAPRASATAELTLTTSTGNTATVTAISCGGTCQTATFNGTLGSWNINVTTGTADPSGQPIMDLNSIDHVNASGSKAQTITLEWSATGLTPASSGFQLNIGGTIGAFGSLTASLYGGVSNTLNDTSNLIGTGLNFSSPPISFGGSESAFLSTVSPNPYSLTEIVTISFSGGRAGQASFDYSVDTIPEPASVLLLGTVMLGAVSLIRRKVAAGKTV
jgi:hypothetical protein